MNKRLLVLGSVRTLARYKLRTCFMSLGIVVGVAALVIMRSMGSGAQADLMGKVERMFSVGSIMIANAADVTRHGFENPGRLTIEDVDALGGQLEQVVDWDPSAMAGMHEVRYRDRTRNQLVVGHSERAEPVWQRGVSRGEFFSRADVQSAARVVLLGEKTAEALFGDEDPVGKSVQLAGAPFRVKGVLAPYGFDPHGLDRDDEVHVPITTLMRRIAKRELISSAKLIVADPERIDDTVEQVAELLRVRHGLADDTPDDFSLFTPTGVQTMVRKANRVVSVYLPATAGIALLVAAIVIANVMLIGVRERSAEIGLRKALGATDRQIGGQFLLESLVLSAISGLLGAGIGAGLLAASAGAHGTALTIAGDSIALGLVAAVAVGISAGFLPALRAARQEPVDALR